MFSAQVDLRSRQPVYPSDMQATYAAANNAYLASLHMQNPPMGRPLGYHIRRSFIFSSPYKDAMKITDIQKSKGMSVPINTSISYFSGQPVYSTSTIRPDANTWKATYSWRPYETSHWYQLRTDRGGLQNLMTVFVTIKVSNMFFIRPGISTRLPAPPGPGWSYFMPQFLVSPGINTFAITQVGPWIPMGTFIDKIYLNIQMAGFSHQDIELINFDLVMYEDWNQMSGSVKNFFQVYATNPASHQYDFIHIPYPQSLSNAWVAGEFATPLPTIIGHDFYMPSATSPVCTFDALPHAPSASPIDTNFYISLIVRLKPHPIDSIDLVEYRINGGAWMSAYAFFKNVKVTKMPYFYLFSVRAVKAPQSSSIVLDVADAQNVYAEERTISDDNLGVARLFDITNNIQLLGQNGLVAFVSMAAIDPGFGSTDLVEWKSPSTPGGGPVFNSVVAEIRGSINFTTYQQSKILGANAMTLAADYTSVYSLDILQNSLTAEDGFQTWLNSGWAY